MPLLYQGQEIGDPDTLNYFTDGKVKWDRIDRKMLHTVRTLVALHHTQPSLAADAPVEYVATDCPQVLAYQRGPVLVFLNLGTAPVTLRCDAFAAGKYTQWLNSKTIADGPSATDVTLDTEVPVELDAKGFVVYVKQ
jgi:glycosidase